MARDLKQRAMAQPQQAGKGGDSLAQKVDAMQAQFAAAMPRGKEAVQLIRDAHTCLRMTPKLAECEHTSVLGALMTCAQLGLRPGVLGQAYLLPMYNGKQRRMEAQLIIGYQGLLELIYRSGMVQMVQARRVHENDEFVLEYGLEGDKLIHRPPATGPRGRVVKWYAIARFKDGGYAFTDPMTREEMEAHRDKYAMAKKDGRVVGPWVTQFDEMADKTVLRRLAKTLPKSPEVAWAIENDGAIRQDYTEHGIEHPVHVDSEVVVEDAPAVEKPATETQDTDQQEPAAPRHDRGNLVAALDAAFTDQKITGQKDRLEWLANLVGDQVTTVDDLTDDEIFGAIDVLKGKK